ncbi:MAG: hypothetical protein ABJ215_00020 [Alphaproteobacteria bacterium]
MSDATLRAEEPRVPEGERSPPPSMGSNDEVVFAGRYKIQPGVLLPHLATSTARAYLTYDAEDPNRELYALVLDHKVPARLTAIHAAKDIPHDALMKPIRWGQVDWSGSGREEIVIILPQPPGPPLLQSMTSTTQYWTVREIKRDFLMPIMDLLGRMQDERLTHRNIRPTNLYRRESDESVVSGQIYSAPPGFEQPSMFETIERAMCPPISRGIGDLSDELFALGVTMLVLGLGFNPVAGMDEEELLRRRIAHGSYNALLGKNKINADLAPAVRSLLRDDEHERWTLPDLSNWANSGRVNPSQPLPETRADRPLEFTGRSAHSRRELAYYLASDWDAALKFASDDAIELWVDRSLKNSELAKEISECGLIGASGPRNLTDDIRLSRIITKLDPTGPIRFRSMVVMPDAIGQASIPAVQSKEMSADYTDLVLGKLMSFWHECQARPKTWMLTASEVVGKAAIFLADTAPGFSIERCVYELNPALPCLSPQLKGRVPLQPRELMECIERHAETGELLFDRHIAAFLAARITGRIDRELHDYGSATSDIEKISAQLRLLAFVQNKNSAVVTKELFKIFLEELQPAINCFRNVTLREEIMKDSKKAASKGRLADLIRIVDNSKRRRWDERGAAAAGHRYAALAAEINKMQTDEKRLQRQANLLGGQIAANVSIIVSVLVVAALVFSRIG